MVLPERNADNKCASFPQLTFHSNETTMQLDEFLHQSQPDARALMCAAPRIRHSMEPLEQPRDCLGRYAYSRISDSQFGEVSNSTNADFDFSIEREFEGVGYQVKDDLLPHVAININRLTEARAIRHQSKSCFIRSGSEHTRQLRREACQVGGLINGFDSACFDAGEIQQRIHQPQ